MRVRMAFCSKICSLQCWEHHCVINTDPFPRVARLLTFLSLGCVSILAREVWEGKDKAQEGLQTEGSHPTEIITEEERGQIRVGKWREVRSWVLITTPSTKFVSRDGFEGRSGEGDGKLVSWGHHAVQNRCLHLLRRRHGKRKRVLCVPHLSVGRQRRGDGKGRDGGDVVKVGPGK